MLLPIKLLYTNSKLPTKAYERAGAWDLYSVETVTIQPLMRRTVGTGIAIKLPKPYKLTLVGEGLQYQEYSPQALVIPKSGRASKEGASIVNSPGLIDNDYTGEIKVIMYNSDLERPLEITAGEKIAQLLRIDVPVDSLWVVDELEETHRGSKGFGSSGLE